MSKLKWFRRSECIGRMLCTYKPRKPKSSVSSKTMNLNVDPKLIRNIGIIAHIDAGKTTVTERLLYLAGATKFLGNVDSGNTVTDFMELERERGITIQSAAVTLFWKKHKINLIDTPGHVDFTLEVERCLRVLDGAVTILDASAGVQAQTMTVWRQARKFSIPSVFFLNKMDKQTADFCRSVDSITERLGLENPINVCIPIARKDKYYLTIADVLNKQCLNFNLDGEARWADLQENCFDRIDNCFSFEQMMAGREEMFSKLADLDDHFADSFLQTNSEDDALNAEALNAMRRLTLTQRVVPVACGSALRCAQSVSPVLDLVISCLPCPAEKNSLVNKVFGNDLSALVFKIGHDKRLGQVIYARVYSGEIKNMDSLFNANKSITENKFNVHIPHSDQLQPVSSVKAGNIAVLTGMKSTVTGDTLVASKRAAEVANERRQKLSDEDFAGAYEENSAILKSAGHSEHSVDSIKSILLAGIETPDPVYFCTIEPPSEASNVKFEKALKELAVEDPSLQVRYDNELGQTVVGAMGELHVEVIRDRLRRDYGLNVFVGSLQVAYREVIEDEVTNTAILNAVFNENEMKHECKITFTLKPNKDSGKFKQVVVLLDGHNQYAGVGIYENWLNAINEGCTNALYTGPSAGFTVYDIEVILTDFVASGKRLNPAVISATASKCVSEALQKAGTRLLEPIMNAEIVTTSKGHAEMILHEVYKRRGIVSESGIECVGDTYVVRCIMPLAELQGFSKNIRIMTSGHASIHLEVSGYRNINERKQKEIANLNRIRYR
uniref:Tr-type G domain-containing protein n=1 Tax=Elaeophora elaphi TaxID=1147741 RepID=A0A0R3S0Q2_9BILA